jgi:hypothetical protein
MTYTLNQVVDYKWHLARRALRVGDGLCNLGLGLKGQGSRHLHHITADFLPSFLYFMMNAHSMPESIRWSIIPGT